MSALGSPQRCRAHCQIGQHIQRILFKKMAEGKHHNVVMSHCAKNLVRVLLHILKIGSVFVPQS